MKFYITDVFGVAPYSGNQLLTVFDNGKLTTEEMQQIAHEINFSETTFITSTDKVDGGYNVRIFTPKSELPFAGHPTIGTAYILDQILEGGKAEKILLNLKIGQIPVTKEGSVYWMRQKPPQFGTKLDAAFMAEVLGLKEDQVSTQFPVQGVSTGMAFTIVPLRDLQALQQAKVQYPIYEKFLESTEAKGIMVVCPEGHDEEESLSTRVFVGYEGIPEDPATGSATGSLASYIVQHKYLGSHEAEIVVGQGYEMGRPSKLYIKSSLKGDEFEINVGGRIFDVASGEWPH